MLVTVPRHFEYTLRFRGTKEHANADALSRLPLPVEPASTDRDTSRVGIGDRPLVRFPSDGRGDLFRDAERPRIGTYRPVPARLASTSSCDDRPALAPYLSKQPELSLYEGCVLWGTWIVVPEPGRKTVLAKLHEGHPGIAQMKSLARMYVWWPGINQDIEEAVRKCAECQVHQTMPPPAPWSWPTRPWTRLHLDYAGPVQGKIFSFQLHGAQAFCTPNATSGTVIKELRTMFAQFSLPETIVTDNGTCFISEFKAFLQANGISISHPHHTTLHPTGWLRGRCKSCRKA